MLISEKNIDVKLKFKPTLIFSSVDSSWATCWDRGTCKETKGKNDNNKKILTSLYKYQIKENSI